MRKVSYPGGTLVLLKAALVLLLALAVAATLLVLFAPSQIQRIGDNLGIAASQKKSVAFATGREGGNYVRIAKILAEDMKIHGDQDVKITYTQGSLENVNLVRNKSADFALIQGGLDHELVDGLCAIAQVSWQYVHILVPADSELSSFRDLKGKRINLGPGLSGNLSLARRILHYFWPGGETHIVHGEIDQLDEDFAAGRADAAFVVYDYHAPIIERMMNSGRYRLLPIHEASSIANALPGCFEAVIPPATYGPDRAYPSIDAPPHKTLKVKTLLITRKGVSRFTVERMLRILFSPRFAKQSGLSELTESMGRDVLELPLHRAAERYYLRNDPITADRFEIGSFFLATVLFLGSVINFLSARAKERHRDRLRERIVPFFEELLDCSKALAETNDLGKLEALLARMMETQRNAEHAWLKGKLDTEHMENLYAIYGIHCSNAFQKVQQLLLARRLELLADQAEEGLQDLGEQIARQ